MCSVGAYRLCSRPDWWLLAKAPLAIILVLLALVALDSMLGYAQQSLKASKPIVEIVRRPGAPGALIVILPGYNQDGNALVRVLGPALRRRGVVLSYKLPRGIFDADRIVDALYSEIRRTDPARLEFYVESAGALDLARLLRRHPDIRILRLTINAGMSSWRSANGGRFLHLTRPLAGGPILTTILRGAQRSAVANSPRRESGIDSEVTTFAEQNSLNITGSQAISEFWRMITTAAIQPGEFAGRIDEVRYLHAPLVDGADDMVHAAQASADWNLAVGPNTRFYDVIVGAWGRGMHVPTPERPSPVIHAITMG